MVSIGSRRGALALISVVLMAFAAALLPSRLLAQTDLAGISGRITDGSGALITGAEVEIRNLDTNASNTVRTNQDGLYTISSLRPGHYLINVRKVGFKSVTVTDVSLNVQDNVVRNFSLQLGSVAETVTVSSDQVNVDTTDAAVSTVVDRQFVENLPLNGRSFQSLLYLTPGVNVNQNITGPKGTNTGGFVVSGQRGDANYWIVDGVSANVASTVGANQGPGAAGTIPATNVMGGTSALVSVDALQEFRIETSSYAPEFGRALGGQISIQTRSGTNQFHGTAFDYVRNGDLDAADWFANNQGVPKAIEKQNDFGGVIGGPVLKDRTFFFFSYEGFRLRLPSTFLGTVPDLAARQNAVPAMQPYLNAYPIPKPDAVEAAPGLAVYAASFSNPSSADAYSIRGDHSLTKNLTLFGRYNQSPSSGTARGGVSLAANVVEKTHQATKTATLGLTWAKSAETVNDVRFNYSSSGGNARYFEDSFGGGTTLSSAGLFPSPFSTTNNGWFIIDPLFGTNTIFLDGFTDPDNFLHQFNAIDTLTTQKGTHTLKFGADYRTVSPKFGFAQYTLVGIFENLSKMQSGTTLLTVMGNAIPTTFLLHNFSAFGQDTWRVNPRLNLTYGLRWDVDFKPSTTSGPNFASISGFSLTDLSNLALGQAGKPPYGTRYGNVAPRVSGAYQLSQNPNWGLVLRSGFGVFYGLASTEIGDYIGVYPQGGSTLLFGASFPTPPADVALPPITPPDSENQEPLFGFDPHLNAPHAFEWNVAFEQSLGGAQTFSLSYVGASDRKLLESESVSNPNPNYASATLVANTGTSSYNALQAQFRRALTSGLQTLISYTWSHSIDSGSYGAYANGSFANVRANRGSSDYDLRHVITAALTYQVPGPRSNRAARAIAGGWSTNNILQIHSASPVDITDANFTALSKENASVLIRPDVVAGQPLYLSGSKYPGGKALNPAAFTDPPVDAATGLPIRQGNLGRNALRAFGLAEWDFAVHREFPIRETVKLQFNAELFNVLNHPNFGPFNTTFQSGNIYFGQATAMQNQLGGNEGWGVQSSLYASGGSRSSQLALKLVF